MRAIGYKEPGSIDRADALVDIEIAEPVATGRDLLVELKAVSVNPVDTKVRRTAGPLEGDWRVLGWDAAGIVKAVGPDVTGFHVGDAVFYAGSLTRPGTNAEYHLVDERIVGAKPTSIGWAEAAALPLTSVTAWEALFDRLEINRPVPGAPQVLLIIGGAGGVGSIAVQLARQLTDLIIIATASRPETQAWATEMGAHHVIDHGQPLGPQIEALGVGAPAYVFSTTHTGKHGADIAALIAPQGRVALIDDPEAFDIAPFKRKSVSIHWEFMYTRSIFATVDMSEQGRLLNEVALLVDAGKLKTTLTDIMSPINAETLRKAHRLLESGTMRGKLVLEGWE